MEYQDLLEQFEQLKKSDKFQLTKAIKRTLIRSEDSNLKNLVTQIREARFSKRITVIACFK